MNPDADPLEADTPVPLALLEEPDLPAEPSEGADRSVGPWPFLAHPGTAQRPAAAATADHSPATSPPVL